MIHCTSFGRAGLLGNPSDGYFGKTISLILDCFPATVTIYESPEIRFESNQEDREEFSGYFEMVREIDRFGYYGGIRLLKATCREFYRWCMESNLDLPKKNFTLRYRTTVPQLVGLGGSSAICTATLKALQKFFRVEIPLQIQPTICWKAESELGIQCGLQDRVIQIYGGLVYMDFEENYFNQHQYGRYERLAPATMPPFYLAYDPARAEFSGIYHTNLRKLAQNRVLELKEALLAGDVQRLDQLINANFDLRRRVLEVSPANVRMVNAARKTGASAKFAGSGGAIIGLYHSEKMLEDLKRSLFEIDCVLVCPGIGPEE